jgi:hypothetical protein
MLGGQVQVMFPVISSVIEYIKAGTLRALAVMIASIHGATRCRRISSLNVLFRRS